MVVRVRALDVSVGPEMGGMYFGVDVDGEEGDLEDFERGLDPTGGDADADGGGGVDGDGEE